MTTETSAIPTASTQAAFPAGQHLHCAKCGSEIEIIRPCGCQPPDQALRCCGQEMRPKSS
jgi:hypothetical protein